MDVKYIHFFDAVELAAQADKTKADKENEVEVEFEEVITNWMECYNVDMRYEIHV